MKEIGGYFELENFVNNEYYQNLIALNSGRNALIYILKARKANKLYMPYFLCDCVFDAVVKNGYEVEYYNIDENFVPIINKSINDGEYVYVVNYYGQLSSKKLLELQREYKNIILDNTHAFFQKPLSNIDTIYNCRKFFGVPDGAYLSTNVIYNGDLELDVSNKRMEHLLGRFEESASNYYQSFSEHENKFICEPVKYMSKLTHNLLGAIDYNRVIKVRKENYEYLSKELDKYNKINLNDCNVAFAYPCYLSEASAVRKKLIEKNIYVPTLWPNVLADMDKQSLEYDYAQNILPLPCDQRYTLDDMKTIVKELKKCIS